MHEKLLWTKNRLPGYHITHATRPPLSDWRCEVALAVHPIAGQCRRVDVPRDESSHRRTAQKTGEIGNRMSRIPSRRKPATKRGSGDSAGQRPKQDTLVAGLQAAVERHLKSAPKRGQLNWLERLDPEIRQQVEAFAADIVTIPGFTAVAVARGIIEWLREQNQPAPSSLYPVLDWLRRLQRQSSGTA